MLLQAVVAPFSPPSTFHFFWSYWYRALTECHTSLSQDSDECLCSYNHNLVCPQHCSLPSLPHVLIMIFTVWMASMLISSCTSVCAVFGFSLGYLALSLQFCRSASSSAALCLPFTIKKKEQYCLPACIASLIIHVKILRQLLLLVC